MKRTFIFPMNMVGTDSTPSLTLRSDRKDNFRDAVERVLTNSWSVRTVRELWELSRNLWASEPLPILVPGQKRSARFWTAAVLCRFPGRGQTRQRTGALQDAGAILPAPFGSGSAHRSHWTRPLRSCGAALIAPIVFVMAARAQGVDSASAQPGLLKSEFIFEQAPFRSCHASTIVETREGLMAAWFGGTREGALDVGIWLSRYEGNAWSEPVEVINGADDEKHIRYPCWNPVLFQPSKGPLLLFYKVGPKPSSWWGMLMKSEDGGRTWSKPRRLPNDIYGPIKNKPVELDDNRIVCGSSTEDAGWRVHMESTRSFGQQWSRTPPLNAAMEFGAIQPAILAYPSGKMQILCRTKQRQIRESWSEDGGHTWSRMKATDLPNPNSGIDATVLRDGRALLVYNHTDRGRGVLNVAISPEGKKWFAAVILEFEPGGEFSYPAVIQANDGSVHVTYTWKRQRIKHAVIDPFKLNLREMTEGQWR